jgi:adenylate/nucleoside-diphosphate kinase
LVGATLKTRKGYEEVNLVENELAFVDAASKALKEAYGDENVKEFPIAGTVEQITKQIRLFIDPFYIRVSLNK